MHESLPFVLAIIIVLGVSAQWIAWRINLPSILLLLILGITAGPILDWVRPQQVFGELLQPCVSFAVALILYEGGFTLRLAELPRVGGVVRNLVTSGVVVTWLVGTAAAHWIFGMSLGLSALLGAILTVTGPTVIGPLLSHIRPTGNVGPILRWEGIVIDPVGALLTVFVYEALTMESAQEAGRSIAGGIVLTAVLGTGLGIIAASLLVFLIYRHWIADHLENAVSLMLVFGVFVISNYIQHESGLLAVTVMGFVLANQKFVDVEHILEFKENLRVLLIAGLFIVLGAALELDRLTSILLPGLLFVAVLVVVARPLGVWLSSARSDLTRNQRAFLAMVAPRGIVAAAISSIFAVRLQNRGFEGAELLVPITFLVIITTVSFYGLLSPAVARWLGVAESNPQGVLFVGAQAWVRELAALLQREGFRVFVVDSNRDNVSAARLAGMPAYFGSVLAEHALDKIDLGGLGRLLAVTSNEWVNVLAVHRFERIFGRAQCYQLPSRKAEKKKKSHKYLHGRWLFDDRQTYASLSRLHAQGFVPKATALTEEFNYDDFRERHKGAVPLFLKENSALRVMTADKPPLPKPGQTLISLVREEASDNTGKPANGSSRSA